MVKCHFHPETEESSNGCVQVGSQNHFPKKRSPMRWAPRVILAYELGPESAKMERIQFFFFLIKHLFIRSFLIIIYLISHLTQLCISIKFTILSEVNKDNKIIYTTT